MFTFKESTHLSLMRYHLIILVSDFFSESLRWRFFFYTVIYYRITFLRNIVILSHRMGIYLLNFLKNCQTAFQSRSIFSFHQQYLRIAETSHPCSRTGYRTAGHQVLGKVISIVCQCVDL